AKSTEHDGADEIPANPTRHSADNAMESVNASSKIQGAGGAVGPRLAVWLRRTARKQAGVGHGRQGEADTGAHHVERHGADGHAARDLPQSRAAIGFRGPVGEGLFHRLAGCRRDRIPGDAGRPPSDRADHRAAWRDALMLAALDLARRIETGTLTPRAVVD